MESPEISRQQRNKSFIFKNLNLSNLDGNNKENPNNSFKSNGSKTGSTTTDEKKSNITKSISLKNIKSRNIDNIKDEAIIKYISNKSNKNLKKRKSNSKKLIFGENKEFSLKVNNNNNQQILKENRLSNDKKKIAKNNKNIILKPYPPQINDLYDFRYNLSDIKNIIDTNISKKQLPNVFINHLILQDNINTNKITKNIPISMTKRIKNKNLTILYYRPLKRD